MRYGLKVKARTKIGPNTIIVTKRDRALIWTPFDWSRKNKQFIIKKVKSDKK